MPELKQLRVLRAVATAGSFTAAAEITDYTQPAVSKIIAALEREMGTPLVDRDSRPLRLTQAGQALDRHAEAIFESLSSAESEVHAIAKLDSGHVRVGTFSSAGAAFFVDALRELRSERADLSVSISEGNPSELMDQLRVGEIDLAVVFDFPQAGEDRGIDLDAVHLLDDPFEVVVPAGHRLASREAVSYADLRDEDWLLPELGPESPTMKILRRECAANGFEPRIVFEVNDCDMTLAMVAAGEGISALPRLILPRDHAGVRMKPFERGAPIRRISAIRMPSRYVAPATDHFRSLLERSAARYAAS